MAQDTATDAIYPESDGQPVGETDIHRQLIWDLVFALSNHFGSRHDVYVTGNLFVYYVKSQPKFVVCPDVCVAFGSSRRMRNTYQTWRDGPFPRGVIELTSSKTRKEDFGPKRDLYERLGVMEYYLFDPRFDPDVEYTPVEDMERTDVTGELHYCHRPAEGAPFDSMGTLTPGGTPHSPLLGLGLTIRGRALRLVDEASGHLLPTGHDEAESAREEAAAARQAKDAARQAQQRAQDEGAARQAAEQRAQELADEVARLRARLTDQAGG